MPKPPRSEKLMELIADHAFVGVEALKPETHFVNDLKFDYLDMTELAMAIEQEMRIAIPDESLDHVNTVRDLDLLVQHARTSKYAKRQPAG